MKKHNRRNQRGFTLIELLTTIFSIVVIVGIGVGYFVLYKGGTYLLSQSVADTDMLEVAEASGYAEVRLVESFRLDPEDAVGCGPADDAGFLVSTSTGKITMCCVGDWGKKPRCVVVKDIWSYQ